MGNRHSNQVYGVLSGDRVTTRPLAVVFLGNPGREYERTRHNAGFLLADHWSASGSASWSPKFKGLWASLVWEGRKIALLKPQNFMNLSGESARAMGEFLKIHPTDWLVVHDDLQVPFGEVKVQKGGGLGGHNGLRSLRQHSGTDQFCRLRIGLGRPVHGEVADFVLGRFSHEEEIQLPLVLGLAGQCLETALRDGVPG